MKIFTSLFLLIIFLIISINADELKSPFSFTIYGFLKADYIYSTQAVLTFGRETLLSPNEVKRITQRDDEQARSNIQVSETRLGVKLQHGFQLDGIIELDFINFDQSSPNVNSRPRLRQAYFNYQSNNKLKFFAGQLWDIYSPVRDASFNIIGNFFYSGNHGWMREQIGLIYAISQTDYLSFALGNAGVNPNPTPSIRLEQNRFPSLAFQWKSILNEKNTFYFSGIFTNKLYQDPELIALKGRTLYYDGYIGNEYTNAPMYPPLQQQTEPSSPLTSQIGKSTKTRRWVNGLSLGHQYTNNYYKLKLELNYGQNVGDIFALSVSEVQATNSLEVFENSKFGYITNSQLQNKNQVGTLGHYLKNQTQFHSIKEMGGWFSFYFLISKNWEIGIFSSVIKVLNPNQLNPSQVANLRSLEVLNPSTNWGTPGNSPFQGSMRENRSLGFNVTFIPKEELSLYIQVDELKTYFKDADRNRGISNHIASYDLDTQGFTLRPVSFGHEKSSAVATAYVFRFGTIYRF